MKILVTGGAGFIGSELVRQVIRNSSNSVVVVDKLTYAGNLAALESVSDSPRYRFEQADICDLSKLHALFAAHRPDCVMHLAAESHVDRSIDGPIEFINTNILGTYNLLQASRRYLGGLSAAARAKFRFHHVSTDEVFGDLGPDDDASAEAAPYRPSSPYSATKASADHLVRAWHRTFAVPVLVTNCSNNYGPFQHAEKLIPLMTLNALEGRPLPVYGSGEQVRDWLHVEDHARALLTVLANGRVGETYNIGASCPRRNIDVVRSICDALERCCPDKPPGVDRYADLIDPVADRPGHDYRYEIDASKIRSDLGWAPDVNFDAGLQSTVEWICEHRDWCFGTLNAEQERPRPGLATGVADV